MSDRRSVGLWLRIVGSVVMLGVLLPRVHLGSVLPDPDGTTPFWLGGALLVTIAGIVVSALRWESVLLALGLPARARVLLNHYFAGLFIGNFLPSTIGGDVLRARRLATDIGDVAGAFASVVLERLTGMVVLPIITLVALASNPGLRHLGTASLLAFVLSISTLLFLTLVLVVAGHPSLGGRFAGDSRFRRFAGAIHLGTDRFRRHPRAWSSPRSSPPAPSARIRSASPPRSRSSPR